MERNQILALLFGSSTGGFGGNTKLFPGEDDCSSLLSSYDGELFSMFNRT